MNALAVFEWGLSHAQDVEELYQDFKDIKAPKPGHFAEFVQSIEPIEMRLAQIADTFPADPVSVPHNDTRLATARERAKAIAPGFLEKLEKLAELAQTFWNLYRQFKPA